MAVFEFNTNADNPRRAFYTIIGDGVEEPDETIVFGLSEPSGVSLVSDRSTAVVNIINDDSESYTLNLYTTQGSSFFADVLGCLLYALAAYMLPWP